MYMQNCILLLCLSKNLIDKELTLPKNAEENVIVEAQQSLCT
jgi:hypothetical protein